MAVPKNSMLMDLIRNEYQSMELADCKIQVGDKRFKAHKFVLCLHSQVFRANFEHDNDVKRTGIIKLDPEQYKTDSIGKMLNFFYTENASILTGCETEMFTLADYFDAGVLKEKCLILMCQNIKLSNCIQYIQIAYQHNLEKFKTKIVNFLSESIEAIEELSGFDELDAATQTDVLKRLFKSANRAGKSKGISIKFGPVAHYRFNDPEEFDFQLNNTGEARIAFHIVDQPGCISFKQSYGFLKRGDHIKLSPWFVNTEMPPTAVEIKYARAIDDWDSVLKLEDPYICWKTETYNVKQNNGNNGENSVSARRTINILTDSDGSSDNGMNFGAYVDEDDDGYPVFNMADEI